MDTKTILFFADRLPPLIGGMEIHAKYFIDHFSNNEKYMLKGVISKNSKGQNIFLNENNKIIKLNKLCEVLKPNIIFFNSGRWIEELTKIKKIFPKAVFIYRTGGNEILKAPLVINKNPCHINRQSYWVNILNNSIDYIITNSLFTERRLTNLGINIEFIRCVGGVNYEILKQKDTNSINNIKKTLVFFCAARFVPYKNHSLLISVFSRLIKKGYQINLRLAGDGPLLKDIVDKVNFEQINEYVTFLGAIDNETTCKEIVRADLYMQLSIDQLTEVEGGSYLHSEGMGRAILEAISAGTFVVAGNSGALSEIVYKERGILIDDFNEDYIVNTLEEIINKPPLALKSTDIYSWNSYFKLYENFFEKINENTFSH